MDEQKIKSIIESMLFAKGEEVEIESIASVLDLSKDDVKKILSIMGEEYKALDRGIELINLEDSVQLCTKKENYGYIESLFDKRNKVNLSSAALEVLAIISYNPKISRAEIENIRGVNSDTSIYRLLEYGLIEEAGKIDAPGKPMGFKTTNEFLRIFGYNSLQDLPQMPSVIDNELGIQLKIEDEIEDIKQEDNLLEEVKEIKEESENGE